MEACPHMYHEGKEIDGGRAAEYFFVPGSGEERNDGEERNYIVLHGTMSIAL
jgi:hypothetical protein